MLQIKPRTNNDVTILELKGRFVSSTEFPFWKAVQAAVVDQGARKLLLNFEGISECDSFGITELLRVKNSVENINGKLYLCGLNHVVEKVLHITKMDEIFNIQEDEQSALQALA